VLEAFVGDMSSIDGLFSLEMLASDGCWHILVILVVQSAGEIADWCLMLFEGVGEVWS